MMQLLCNGTQLDLYEGAGLQFTHKNPLFAFDKLECERTTEFKLPCTPTNDGVLSLARIPAYAGTGMRQRFSAELIDGILKKTGYIYVSGFDGKDYKAIFVTGELVGLQTLKNAGSVRDVLGDSLGYFDFDGTSKTITGTTKAYHFDALKYRTSGSIYPSSDLKWLIDSALTQLGVTHSLDNHYFRIIPKELEPLAARSVSFTRSNRSMDMPSGFVANFLTTQQSSFVFNTYLCWEDADDPSIIHKTPTPTTYNVTCLVPIVDITLKFPNDYPDYMVISPDGSFFPSFLSSRKLDNQGNISGTPLAGSSVEIPKNTPFYIVKASDFVYRMDEQPLPYPQTWNEYWGWQPDLAMSFGTCTMSGSSDVQVGDRIAVCDNIPDLTVVELCKVWAALTGTVLNYSDANGVTFDPLNLNSFPVKTGVKLILRGEVSRTFADYGQKNIVCFDSGAGVYDFERISTSYNIDNKNLKEENDLQVLPFSEGGASGADILVRSYNDNDLIANADVPSGETWQYMQRVSLPKNSGVQSLCDASTQFKVDAHMILMEYEDITAKTVLNIDGTQYIWTERSWQKDIAKFILAKI